VSILIEQDTDAAALRRGTRQFLLAGALVATLIVAAILVRQGLFRQTASLGFITDTAQDISKGQSVKIAGFRVGSVEAVNLRPDGKVEVALEVDASYMRFVTRDAVIELRKEGLIGSAMLEIIPGADKTRLAADEAVLTFSRSEGLSALANNLRDKITPILADIKTITGTLADPRLGLSSTLAKAHDATDSLNALLVTGNQQARDVGGGATRVLAKANTDLGQVGHTLETVNNALPVILDKAQRIMVHVESITADAESSVPPALRDGGALATDVREIVSGAKTAWPIRGLVAVPVGRKLVTDSDPRAEGGRAVP
jgi:phospholipid/cholesterol/gamma-HCH transport system substrate-binding protein